MSKLTLYTSPESRGRITRWMLEEIGRPYEIKVLSAGTPNKSPDYLNINPMGKVPTVVHGENVVTEAAAICTYLADAFPEASLAPNPQERASYYRWLFFAAGPLEAAISNHLFGFVVPEELEKSIGYGNLQRVINTLEVAVSRNDYIAGKCFSAADVYVGSQVGLGLQFGVIEKRPAIEAYWERVSQREAYLRAQELEGEV